MVCLLLEGGIPRSTLWTSLVPIYVRKNASVSQGGSEGTCARMRAKTPDIQIRIWFSSWNNDVLSGKLREVSETLKSCFIDIFV